MIWLGIDFETTGLNTKEDRITEVGAVLWDARKKKPLTVFNTLVWDASYPKLSPEIIELTGIEDDDLRHYGKEPVKVWCELLAIATQAHLLMAHNGTNFDKPFLENELERAQVYPSEPLSWIDTSVDLPFPDSIQTRKLTHLAAEHGFLNPFAHRAVFDVMTMLNVASRYDVDEIARLASSPSVTIRAVVTYEDKDQARTRGYRWNAEKRIWVKTVKKVQLEKELTAPFNVRILEETNG